MSASFARSSSVNVSVEERVATTSSLVFSDANAFRFAVNFFDGGPSFSTIATASASVTMGFLASIIEIIAALYSRHVSVSGGAAANASDAVAINVNMTLFIVY